MAKAALIRNFEFRLPLSWLLAVPGSAARPSDAGRSQAGRNGDRADQPAAPALQPLAKSSARGCVAGGGLDRTAVGERSGVCIQECKHRKLPSKAKRRKRSLPASFANSRMSYCPALATAGVIASGRLSSSVSSVPAISVAERCLLSQ